MDLALNLGVTTGEIEREMTGVDFNLWMRYADYKMLPYRRLELYLAQIALKIVQVMGGNAEAELSDFLFDPESNEEVKEEIEPEAAHDAAVIFFDFKPRNAPKE